MGDTVWCMNHGVLCLPGRPHVATKHRYVCSMLTAFAFYVKQVFDFCQAAMSWMLCPAFGVQALHVAHLCPRFCRSMQVAAGLYPPAWQTGSHIAQALHCARLKALTRPACGGLCGCFLNTCHVCKGSGRTCVCTDASAVPVRGHPLAASWLAAAAYVSHTLLVVVWSCVFWQRSVEADVAQLAPAALWGVI